MKNEVCDILIVGSGAAGMMAAATSSGLDTLLVESTDGVGVTTALSGGTLWIPANPVSQAFGVKDNRDLGNRYLESVLGPAAGDRGALESDRRSAFIAKGPEMVGFLQNQIFKWISKPSTFPDYHPQLQGAMPTCGRTIDRDAFDAESLEDWSGYLQLPKPASYTEIPGSPGTDQAVRLSTRLCGHVLHEVEGKVLQHFTSFASLYGALIYRTTSQHFPQTRQCTHLHRDNSCQDFDSGWGRHWWDPTSRWM